jgi:serine/threonine protein kinase
MTGPLAGLDEGLVNDLLALAVPDALGAEQLAASPRGRVYRVVLPAMTSVVVKIVAADVVRATVQRHRDLGPAAGLLPLHRAGGLGAFGYLVYPHLTETLADRVENRPLAPAAVAAMLRDVAAGLKILHSRGFVHGDLKPTNVLLAANDTAMLSDLDEVVAIGQPAFRVTPGFAAPEQLTGQALDPRADVYSFAALILTAVTGGTRWVAAPSTFLAVDALPGVPDHALDSLRADLSLDPAQRTVPPEELLGLLTGPSGPAPVTHPPSSRTVPPPVPVPTPAPPPAPVPASAGDASPAVLPGATDDLVVAAQRAWGFVDLRAVTIDRPALQLLPPPPPVEDDEPDRSLWRRPVMVVSLVVGLLLVIAGILFGFVL